jgi:hypothetical protein
VSARTAALITLALIPSGCDARREVAANASITVKLPPARPWLAAPGFAFQRATKSRSQVY